MKKLTIEEVLKQADAEGVDAATLAWRLTECQHEDERAVKRIISSGAKVFGLQCTCCGRWQARKRNSFPLSTIFAQFDESVSERFYRWRRSFCDKVRDQRPSTFELAAEQRKQEYHEYLQTDTWRRLRKKALERDNWTCQGCLDNRATEVHHKQYPHILGNEPLFDLVSVCRECHEKVHGK